MQPGIRDVSSGWTSFSPAIFFDADHAFMLGLVGQPGRPGQIADGIDARFAGARIGIGFDMGSVDFDLGAFQTDVFDIANDARRRK